MIWIWLWICEYHESDFEMSFILKFYFDLAHRLKLIVNTTYSKKGKLCNVSPFKNIHSHNKFHFWQPVHVTCDKNNAKVC